MHKAILMKQNELKNNPMNSKPKAVYSSATQNYLKSIFEELHGQPKEIISMGHLAKVMQITPGTATTMMKAMDKSGLVNYQSRSGVCLTLVGQQAALEVIRKHRLIELFLVEILHMDWAQVHQEAEVLEHWVSSEVLLKMEELLGFPTLDPHGDPIPNVHGKMVDIEYKSLHSCQLGDWLEVSRILNQNKAFLNFAEGKKLLPGQKVKVMSRDLQADVTDLMLADETRFSVGLTVAKKILVKAGNAKENQPSK